MGKIKDVKQQGSVQNIIEVREIDISDEQYIRCPHCRSEDIEFKDAFAQGMCCTDHIWKCNECGKVFTIRQRTYLLVEMVDQEDSYPSVQP